MITRQLTFAIAATATLAACRSRTGDTPPTAGDSAALAAGSLEGPSRTDSAGAMAGMPGMAGDAGGTMTDSVRAAMQRMQAMSGTQMKAALPAHRQMVANMLARMNQEMRGMNMPATAAWTATVDSIRQDLVHMPDMSAAELTAAMPDHGARVVRLGEMHQAMMRMSGPRP